MGLAYGGAIVRDGLVLALDAADRNSYPGTGTTWYDLSGNNEDFTLNNTPTYSSTNNGIFTFDGVDDYAEANTAKVIPDTGPFSVVFAFALTGTGGRGGIFERNTASPYNGFSLGQGGTGNWGAAVSSTATFSDGLFVTFTYPTTNVFYIDVVTFNGSNTLKGYRNGVLVVTDTDGTQGNLSTQGTRQNFTIARRDLASAELPCKVASVQVYTKELSPSEVLQNYNATKSRFGL
jgi:hypothetical protein